MAFANYQLPNGLQVVVDPNSHSQLTAVGYFVRAGACDETPQLSGISHFLEHMCFKGTPRRTALEINQQLDDLGANCNARTSEESTIYHATVLPEFQREIVELLTDMMHPTLMEDDFETEKQVILEEIAMYRDQPPYGGHEQIMAQYFGDHPLGQPVLGTEQSVSGLTPQLMRDYHRQSYSPSNIVFAAAGRVDVPQLLNDLERLTSEWPKCERPLRRLATVQGIAGQDFLSVPQSNQTYILQLSPGPSHDDPGRFAARLAAAIFGDDTGSRLFWEFVDSGRADLAGTGHYEFEGSGVLMSMLALRPEDTREIWTDFERLERELITRPPTARELDLAKAKAIAGICSSGEISENRMFDIGGQWITYGNYKPIEEIVRLFNQVTLADIHHAIERFPTTHKNVLFIGPTPIK